MSAEAALNIGIDEPFEQPANTPPMIGHPIQRGDLIQTGINYVERVIDVEGQRDKYRYLLVSYDVHGRRERWVDGDALKKMGAVKIV